MNMTLRRYSERFNGAPHVTYVAMTDEQHEELDAMMLSALRKGVPLTAAELSKFNTDSPEDVLI